VQLVVFLVAALVFSWMQATFLPETMKYFAELRRGA
jgi:hypothetical protein